MLFVLHPLAIQFDVDSQNKPGQQHLLSTQSDDDEEDDDATYYATAAAASLVYTIMSASIYRCIEI